MSTEDRVLVKRLGTTTVHARKILEEEKRKDRVKLEIIERQHEEECRSRRCNGRSRCQWPAGLETKLGGLAGRNGAGAEARRKQTGAQGGFIFSPARSERYAS